MLPLAIAINAIPIIAFAPVANNWFGITSPLSKMAIAATLVYFPMMINDAARPDPGGAIRPRADALLRGRTDGGHCARSACPIALPFFLTGLKVATTLSLIGAVVGEYFGGLSATLGRVVVAAASGLKFDVTWAAILVGVAHGHRDVPDGRAAWNGCSSRGTPPSAATRWPDRRRPDGRPGAEDGLPANLPE